MVLAPKEAALQLHQGCQRAPKEVKGAQLWSWVKRLYVRIISNAVTKENILFKMETARVKATVGCSDYLDCRNPSNESQFIDALQTYNARKASQQSDGVNRQ